MAPNRRLAALLVLWCVGIVFAAPEAQSRKAPSTAASQEQKAAKREAAKKHEAVLQDAAKKAEAAQKEKDSVAQTILDRARVLRSKNRYTEAIAIYTELIASGISGEVLEKAKQEKIVAALEKTEAEDKVAATVSDILANADSLRESKQYDEAIAAYTELMTQPGISDDIKTRARINKNAATVEKAKASNPGGLAAAWATVTDFALTSTKALVTLLLWIFVLGVVAAIVILARKVIPAKNGLLIEVQDLSVTDRDNGSRILSTEIAQLLSPPAADDGGDLKFESMTDFEGSGSASIRPMVQLPAVDSLLSATANVAIGPIQFTPASLWALLRRLVQPRYSQTLTGALFVQGNRTVLTVEMKDKNGRTLPDSSWQIAQDSGDARRGVLRKLAAKTMILQAAGRGITTNANSLDAALEGIDHLRASTGRNRTPEKLREAAVCFQAALDHDPDNWLARFNLSVLSRQLGDNEFAIQNCAILGTMIERGHPPSLVRYVAEHPPFPDYVRYNQALALSKIPRWEANEIAVNLLDEVIAREDDSLEPLAKSAKATALLFPFARFREAGNQAKANQIEEMIVQICAEFEAPPQNGVLSPRMALASAVARNARGVLLDLKGDRRGARDELEAAAALQPSFVDAHINLGRIYRHGEDKVASDWVVRAKGHLEAALALQPKNRDANYEMGRLLASEAVLSYAEALLYFERAAPHSLGAYFAAQIYFETDFLGGDPAKGFDQLRTSVRLAADVDFRLGKLNDRFLDAAQRECDTGLALLAQAQLPPAPQRLPGSPLPADVQKHRNRAIGFLDEADRTTKRMTRKGDDSIKRWAEKAQKRAAEIRQRLPV